MAPILVQWLYRGLYTELNMKKNMKHFQRNIKLNLSFKNEKTKKSNAQNAKKAFFALGGKVSEGK